VFPSDLVCSQTTLLSPPHLWGNRAPWPTPCPGRTRVAASRSQKCKGDSPAPPLLLLCIDCLAKPGYSLRFRTGTPGLPALEEPQSQKRLRGTVRARFERRISCLASRHRWQMKTSGTLDLRILAQERWIQVAHSLHSIMGRPAKGFRQKQVIRSQASSSGQGKRHQSETILTSCRSGCGQTSQFHLC